jgi:hypothetical protein
VASCALAARCANVPGARRRRIDRSNRPAGALRTTPAADPGWHSLRNHDDGKEWPSASVLLLCPICQPTMRIKTGTAIFVGWMTQLGLSALLPTIALAVGRAAYMAGGGEGSWGEYAHDPGQSGWHLTQAAILIGSCVAGWLAGRLAPGRPVTSAVALLLLTFLSRMFEQLPMPPLPLALLEWTLAPCIGIIAGSIGARLTRRSEPAP